MLTNLAFSVELFHTADGTAFADLMIDGHRETWPVRSTRLRSWLRRKYYEAVCRQNISDDLRLSLREYLAHLI